MLDNGTVLQLVTLVVSILLFEVWERMRPARSIDRRRRLALNVLAFAIVMGTGNILHRIVVAGFDTLQISTLLGWLQPLRDLPAVPKILLGVVLADFSLYWVHRWMHGPMVLWRAHRFHHSIEELNWLSGARTSVFHLLLFAIPQVFISLYLLKMNLAEAAIAYSFGIFVNLWVHANVTANLGPLNWVFVTPDVHRTHHSRDLNPSKNLGFIFTIWDRMFGTYLDPATLERDYPLGLREEVESVPKMIAGV
jgi:sterol desaturase/sphingolipid hydroxylase (fatty acid hydroxylase superfamily)